jgi:hypothetical protein
VSSPPNAAAAPSSRQGDTVQGVGEYLVAGHLIPCRFYPAPTPPRPKNLPKGAVIGGPTGDILFADD